MTTVSDQYWVTLNKFRGAAESMFQKDVLSYPSKLAEYDQVIDAAREALAGRGLDLTQPEQVYVVSSVISWMSNFMAGLTAARCEDPHVFAHLREAISWPAFLVRELTLDLPNPIVVEDANEAE